jgi:putative hemolysin
MSQKGFLTIFVLIGMALLAACNPQSISPTPQSNLPNPASVYCEENGGQLEMRQDASGGVQGICIFPDGSECDEWAYYRGECSPASESVATPVQTAETDTNVPTVFPTPLPIDAADYEGWWNYTHTIYGFSMMFPEDWTVEEIAADDPLLGGHLLNLHPQNGTGKENIRMTFRRVGEETLLWPTGVGQGEFVPQGTLDVAGQPAERVLLVCPTGEVTAIWYHQDESQPNIMRGDLEFGFIFTAADHCEAGYSLTGKTEQVGEMIIASLSMP